MENNLLPNIENDILQNNRGRLDSPHKIDVKRTGANWKRFICRIFGHRWFGMGMSQFTADTDCTRCNMNLSLTALSIWQGYGDDLWSFLEIEMKKKI